MEQLKVFFYVGNFNKWHHENLWNIWILSLLCRTNIILLVIPYCMGCRLWNPAALFFLSSSGRNKQKIRSLRPIHYCHKAANPLPIGGWCHLWVCAAFGLGYYFLIFFGLSRIISFSMRGDTKKKLRNVITHLKYCSNSKWEKFLSENNDKS
jgi:hypothetical protein